MGNMEQAPDKEPLRRLASGMELPLGRVADICRRYRIREMAVFGSAAREDFAADSDIDLMVEFERGYHPGLGWFDLEDELRLALGRRVDLTQRQLLKPRVRQAAEREGVVLYAA